MASTLTLSLSQANATYTPAPLRFNKNGFATVKLGDEAHNDLLVQFDVKIGKYGLDYSDMYKKWQLHVKLSDESRSDLEKWYSDFQTAVFPAYNIEAEFKGILHEDLARCAWPRTYKNGEPTSDAVPVCVQSQQSLPPGVIGNNFAWTQLTPNELADASDFTDMIVHDKPFTVVVSPSVWVRAEQGKPAAAGVNLTLKSVKLV